MDLVNSIPSSQRMRACDVEPIHIPGSIQPHGLLLLFDTNFAALVHWAGDFNRLLGISPTIDAQPYELFGAAICDQIRTHMPSVDAEAVLMGSIQPANKEPLTVVVSKAGPFIAVELEPVAHFGTTTPVLEQVRAISDRICSMATLSDACTSAAEYVRSIIGYDRVMVYQFLPDWSGSVIAEANATDLAPYIHHRFPASDIPAQARQLYRRNLIRVIPDASYTAVPLQPDCNKVVVDMSQCVLRSVSPVHLQYLKNMGVGASMSVSLIVDGKLWGLIACHNRSPRNISAEARLLCRHVGMSLSAFILSYGHADDLSRHTIYGAALEKILKSLRATNDPERLLRSSAEQLAKLVDCSAFALLADGELVAGTGELPNDHVLRELAALAEEKLIDRDSFVTECISEHIPGDLAEIARSSGIIALKIEVIRPLLALWIRPEQVEEITWAGDPHAKDSAIEPTTTLTPRRSFAAWKETVKGRSRPWSWHEINVLEVFQGRAEHTIQRHSLKQAVEELNVANATLSTLATTDALTGLPNRRLFDERLTTAWQKALRDESSVAVVAIDVDNFKKYNDLFGHPAGDECLKQVAAALGKEHRQVDVAARLGGEEFGLLLLNVDACGAAFLAERVRLAVEKLKLEHPLNETGVVTISLGIAAGTPTQCGSPEGLMNAADQALYQAKSSGRNRVCLYSSQPLV